MKVFIIGNNASGEKISDGGRIKIRLYASLLAKCSYLVEIIDLDGWKLKILKQQKKIKAAVKEKSIILIMAGPNGCRLIIPFVNRINKKKLSRVVYCPLGIGTIDSIIKKMDKEQVDNFINSRNFYGKNDSKMGLELKKLDLIIPQNEQLVNLYKTSHFCFSEIILKIEIIKA